jgi:hypothetical protein
VISRPTKLIGHAGCQTMHVSNKVSSAMGVAISVVACTMLTLGATPALAVEQCRFIQARAEREACYARQEATLAAKRKPEIAAQSKTMESLEQMKHEDEALNRQLHSICRGC